MKHSRHAIHPPRRLLPGATDTHVHVFDPQRFSYVQSRTYTPAAALVPDLGERHRQLGIERVVLVQPSVYGTDNTCLLDALATIGSDHGRGIAVADLRTVTRHELAAWHEAGIRGLRLNFEVRHITDVDAVADQLKKAAELVDLPGWCLQIHCGAGLLAPLASLITGSDVPVVLDHFGGLKAADASVGSDTMRTMVDLLQSGRVYVKLSAFYRASTQQPEHADLAPLAKALMAVRPDRLLWGSDWPHTGGGADRDPHRIEPFRTVDLPTSLAALQSWCSGPSMFRQILVSNPAQLYGFGIPPQPDQGTP